MAGYDPQKVMEIATTWPLRDTLLAFEDLVVRHLREDYQHRMLQWAVRSPWSKAKPPEVPALLKRRTEG